MTSLLPSLAAVYLPRGTAVPFPLVGGGDLPAGIASMRGVGRAFPVRSAQLGVALEEVHQGGVGGDEPGRGSIGHVTLHVRGDGYLNPAGQRVTWHLSGKLPC